MLKSSAAWLALAVFLVSSPVHSQEQSPRELFSKAYALFSANDPRSAEELFLRTLDRGFILEDYSLHFLAVIAAKTGNAPAARQYYAQLHQKFPDSLWLPDADLQLARSAVAEKDYVKAIDLCRALRASRAKKDIADEATYLLALSYEGAGDWKQSYGAYQEVRRAAPLSPWDAPARKAVATLRDRFPELFPVTAAEAQLAEADLLTREQAYADAEKAYRKLLDATGGGFRSRVLAALGNLYRAQRKRDEAIPVLAEVVQKFPDNAETPAALNQLAQIYWNRDEDAKALEYFKLMRQRYPKSQYADFAWNATGRIYESSGKADEALAAYQSVAKQGTDAQMREEGAWRAAWIYYWRKDDANANAAFKRLAASKDANKYRLASVYWQARTAARMEQTDEAKRLYTAVLNDADESYYKGASVSRLARMGIAVEEKKIDASPPEAPKPPALTAAQTFHLSRAQELADLALPPLATAELDEVKGLGSDELAVRLLLLREYARNGAYNRAVALANQPPLVRYGDELARYRYPLAYWESIQKLAKENGIDPYLVVSLIRQESLFDPRAVSPASAHGLMQLLHSTASRTAALLKLSAPPREKLYEPEVNLKLGIHHLKELLQRFSNDYVKAIAAYNAGEHAVSRWETRFAGTEEDEFIERIPYSETQLYVKLVLRNLRVYKKIYGEQK
ncbi:MAG TPA: transglycosylase SLT domain-containing protein [Verrucomicrobiae bacterium]|jgi:soluble lytic murein transglycosylase|nr:transglycosylase SLT domain-containing protein [Verrucomicrobiae bacterium]